MKKNKKIKVCLCCIAKMENLYIREFVEHYITLGFDKIFLYDNNDIDGENFETVIKDYIDNKTVTVIDYRGRKMCQTESYQDCYDKQNKNYDWIFTCDCDEFLILPSCKGIKEFLRRECFNDYGCIFINWRIMNDGDKNLLYYDGKPLMQRFDHFNEDDGVNMHTKSFIRGNQNGIIWNNGTHSPFKTCKTCDCEGNEVVDPNNILYGPNYKEAYLKHFIVKAPSEFLAKMERKHADLTDEESRARLNENFYFSFSKKTKEKENIFMEKKKEYGRTL